MTLTHMDVLFDSDMSQRTKNVSSPVMYFLQEGEKQQEKQRMQEVVVPNIGDRTISDRAIADRAIGDPMYDISQVLERQQALFSNLGFLLDEKEKQQVLQKRLLEERINTLQENGNDCKLQLRDCDAIAEKLEQSEQVQQSLEIENETLLQRLKVRRNDERSAHDQVKRLATSLDVPSYADLSPSLASSLVIDDIIKKVKDFQPQIRHLSSVYNQCLDTLSETKKLNLQLKEQYFQEQKKRAGDQADVEECEQREARQKEQLSRMQRVIRTLGLGQGVGSDLLECLMQEGHDASHCRDYAEGGEIMSEFVKDLGLIDPQVQELERKRQELEQFIRDSEIKNKKLNERAKKLYQRLDFGPSLADCIIESKDWKKECQALAKEEAQEDKLSFLAPFLLGNNQNVIADLQRENRNLKTGIQAVISGLEKGEDIPDLLKWLQEQENLSDQQVERMSYAIKAITDSLIFQLASVLSSSS